MTHNVQDPRNGAHTALYAPLAGAEGCGPAARIAQLANDDELADFLCKVQAEIVEEAERGCSPSGWPSRYTHSNAREEATDVKHEEFARRASRRLEAVADRLEDEVERHGIYGEEASETMARVQEMRVAAFIVREEAEAVSKAEEEQFASGPAPLEAQA